MGIAETWPDGPTFAEIHPITRETELVRITDDEKAAARWALAEAKKQAGWG